MNALNLSKNGVRLKPCPFCGSHDIKDDVYMRDGRQVVCRECRATVGAYNPDANAVAVTAWNRRHDETPSEFDRLCGKDRNHV